jgi:DNA repair exonuclease SbcCD ATPase subunit
MGHYSNEILRNAEAINQLHSRIQETVKSRDKNDHKYKEWQSACKEFHSKYNHLAFPGGFDGAFERIVRGDVNAVEAALSFVECRPYFFRSGYMFKDILRKLKKAPLDSAQIERLNLVLAAYLKYRESKKA